MTPIPRKGGRVSFGLRNKEDAPPLMFWALAGPGETGLDPSESVLMVPAKVEEVLEPGLPGSAVNIRLPDGRVEKGVTHSERHAIGSWTEVIDDGQAEGQS
jgi:hypothetical protein